MHFDSTISIGNVIEIIVFLVGFVGLGIRLGSLETKVDAMWKNFLRKP